MKAKDITKGSTLLATIRSEFPKSTATDLEDELHAMIDKALSLPVVGLTLPLPDENSMRQIAQHVRNTEDIRDPLIYEKGIIRGMQIMKNIVSNN